ncbi:hypothetical protein SV7mr_35460 [Stieleria bergensis]|uniref:GYF domain-containing protein n=1 Tax=Stieleria bergensis TaxID=2528025 RepID=A0A517SXY7_9BACT|nr:hypothetical protein SV7mr_35460 [Planctomycetes bacterium SV_7m_r]
MGVRFRCHSCAKPLNIKQELAGRRGVCPACKTRFRIPLQDADLSIALNDRATQKVATQASAGQSAQPFDDAIDDVLGIGAHSAAGATGSASMHYGGSDQGGSDEGGVATVVQDTQTNAPDQPVDQPVDSQQDSQGEVQSTQSDQQWLAAQQLNAEPNAAWYVRPPSGGQYGPANTEVFQEWIREGRVARNSLIWRDGWAQWRPASEALEQLGASLPAPAKKRPAAAKPVKRTEAPVIQTESSSPASRAPVPASRAPVPASRAPVPASRAPVPASTPTSSQKPGVGLASSAGRSVATNSEGSAAASAGFDPSERLSGSAELGMVKRQRTRKRMLSAGLLFAVALALIVVLVVVVIQTSPTPE